jgi:hypothetical protein
MSMTTRQLSSLPPGAVTETHPDYDALRAVWNADIDRYPLAILKCETVEEVQAAVRYTVENQLPLAVRGGGHSFPGHSVCDAGIVIDLSPMNRVRVDPEARTADVGGGAKWRDVDHACQEHGLAVPAGIVSHTGVAGLTLGGGMGYLTCLHGLTCDNLLAVELVDAKGDLLQVDVESYPDLFWGLRGGGGNFGIATKFVFQLHPVGPDIVTGFLVWPFDQAGDVMRFYRDEVSKAPDHLFLSLHVIPGGVPEEAAQGFLPEALWGQPIIVIRPSYFGPLDMWTRELERLRSFGPPTVDTIETASYLSLQSTFDEHYGPGQYWYLKANHLKELDDHAIEAIIECAGDAPLAQCEVEIGPMGRVVGTVPADTTAFGDRAHAYLCECISGWTRPEDRDIALEWSRRLHEALVPSSTGKVYTNMLVESSQRDVSAAYGAEHYRRLREVKRRYDPENVFRLNPNILPAD